MSRAELRAISVGVDRGGRRILHDVNLVASSGQMLVVTGPSGSGKSVLAAVLAGIIKPDRGEISRLGVLLRNPEESNVRTAFVPQDFGLVSTLTAAETIALPLQVRAAPRAESRACAARWLVAMGLESCANRLVTDLSGGQRQRVAIARALAMDAAIIVMDEPTAELDPANRDRVLSLLATELERGAALVVVSHERDVISRADSVYELSALRPNRIPARS
jgi:putative ABC transport system ATP-binding protein